MELGKYSDYIRQRLPQRIKNLEDGLKALRGGHRTTAVALGEKCYEGACLNSTWVWAECPRELAEIFLEKALNAARAEHHAGLHQIGEWEKVINGKEV